MVSSSYIQLDLLLLVEVRMYNTCFPVSWNLTIENILYLQTIYNAVLVAEVCKANAKDVKFFEKVHECFQHKLIYVFAFSIA